jgi:hypothetical protein
MREKFLQLLPFYVNQTLSADERAFVEQTLREQPKLQAEVDFAKALQRTVLQDAAQAPADIGLNRVLAQIQVERSNSPQVAQHAIGPSNNVGKKPTEVPSARSTADLSAPPPMRWWQRLLGDGNWMQPALAMSLLVIATQSFLLLQKPQYAGQYRGEPAPGAPVGTHPQSAYLSVVFQPTISEAQLRLLLASLDAEIVAGPGAAGEYRLRLPSETLLRAQASLQQGGLVVSVAPAASP